MLKILNMKNKKQWVRILIVLIISCPFMIGCNYSECKSYYSFLITTDNPKVYDFKKYNLVLTDGGFKFKNPFNHLGEDYWTIKEKKEKKYFRNENKWETYFSKEDIVKSISIISDSNLNYTENYMISLYKQKFEEFENSVVINISNRTVTYNNNCDQKKIIEFEIIDKKTKITIYFDYEP
jgi:hypothetical protein